RLARPRAAHAAGLHRAHPVSPADDLQLPSSGPAQGRRHADHRHAEEPRDRRWADRAPVHRSRKHQHRRPYHGRRRKEMIRRAALVWALAIGCGPNAAEVQKAKGSAYNTDFSNVWNACDTELKERFHADGLKVEDPEKGLIETKWEPVETRSEDQVTQGDQR